MNLMSRAERKSARDRGKARAEDGMKAASGKIAKVESALGQKVSAIQDEAKGRFIHMAAGKIDELEARLEELKESLPQRRKKRPAIVAKLFLLTIIVSGVVAAACVVKSKLRSQESSDSEDSDYGSGGETNGDGYRPTHEPRGVRSVGSQSEKNDIADDRGERPSGNSADPRPESRSQTSATSPNDPASAKLNAPLGKGVVDAKGAPIGQVERVYYRRPSWEPEWAGVAIGLVDKKTYLVPLADAAIDEKVKVSYTKEQVETAPQADRDGLVSEETEMQAYVHYNLRRELPEAISPSIDEDEMKLHAWPLQPDAIAS